MPGYLPWRIPEPYTKTHGGITLFRGTIRGPFSLRDADRPAKRGSLSSGHGLINYKDTKP
jgi:hypothetical protein